MINKSFIFIAGHHRSGTSLLHQILREHPLISGFSNTGVPEDEGQHLQTVYDSAKAYGGPGKYIFDPNSRMTENHFLATDLSAQTILRQWEKYYDTSREHYIEKSPPNLIRTRFLQKLFPNSKFVIVLRHPLAVSLATQKWSKTSIESILEHTLLGYEILRNDIPHLLNAYIIRYEDFIKNPNNEIQKIYNFLNLPIAEINQKVERNLNEKYFLTWETNKNKAHIKDKSKEEIANLFGYSLGDYRALLPSKILGPQKNTPYSI